MRAGQPIETRWLAAAIHQTRGHGSPFETDQRSVRRALVNLEARGLVIHEDRPDSDAVGGTIRGWRLSPEARR